MGRVNAGADQRLYAGYIVDVAKTSSSPEASRALEIEGTIGGYPGVPDVAEVAVVRIGHERWGETVHAVVVRAPERTSSDGVIGWCRDRLGSFNEPALADFVDSPPVSPTGKVLKRQLR